MVSPTQYQLVGQYYGQWALISGTDFPRKTEEYVGQIVGLVRSGSDEHNIMVSAGKGMETIGAGRIVMLYGYEKPKHV